MLYLIDTDWVIDQLGDVEAAIELLEELSEDGIAISVITYMEVYQGLDRSLRREDALAKFAVFLEGVPVVPFSLAIARRCARLREHLRQHGKRVNSRAFDLMIAATALEYNLTLVTRNVRDYDDIPNLMLYQAS